MRLINTSTLDLVDFSMIKIPPYAILSHTWSDDEVSFHDMSLVSRASRRGFTKIKETCRLAKHDGLGFAWVDTCCIDKSSSAELTESINSMFQYYENAQVCYVFLEDLLPGRAFEDGLADCRWISRGWTLQELLAPMILDFYDMAWIYRGSKTDFISPLLKCTGIPRRALTGELPLKSYSIAQRMSWAARRETTRLEDVGYCLLGIFDVNMPLIYGEGRKAFLRLQEEIVKRNDDLSIFAWDSPRRPEQKAVGIFAPSPAAFAASSGIAPFSGEFVNFSVTNKGLFISGEISLQISQRGKQDQRSGNAMQYFVILASDMSQKQGHGGIYLRKIAPKMFYRDGRCALAGFGNNTVDLVGSTKAEDFYILIDPVSAKLQSATTFRDDAIHIPPDDSQTFELDDIVPETLWDETDRMFLLPKPYDSSRYPMVLAMSFRGTLAGTAVPLVVLCDYKTKHSDPVCRLFDRSLYPREADLIFAGRYKTESMYWADLEVQAPIIQTLTDNLEVKVGTRVYTVSASFVKGARSREDRMDSDSNEAEVFSLNFSVTWKAQYSRRPR